MVEKDDHMTNFFPVISCICITRGKPEMLSRAIGCFTAQIYPSKELIIVYEEDDDATIAFLKSGNIILQDECIRSICVSITPKLPLGELRNIGINAAAGEYICQWDDDDWYHTKRLYEQFRVIRESGYDSSILAYWLVFDAVRNKSYISNRRLWEGSILCKKTTLLLKPYEQIHIGEDTPTIDFLVESNLLQPIDRLPFLYIYVYHGSNTWDQAHWNFIFECSTALREKDSQMIAAILNGDYSPAGASFMLDEIVKHYYDEMVPEINK
jgi:glycosyltransferase involved in cell wall biosynthesis